MTKGYEHFWDINSKIPFLSLKVIVLNDSINFPPLIHNNSMRGYLVILPLSLRSLKASFGSFQNCGCLKIDFCEIAKLNAGIVIQNLLMPLKFSFIRPIEPFSSY